MTNEEIDRQLAELDKKDKELQVLEREALEREKQHHHDPEEAVEVKQEVAPKPKDEPKKKLSDYIKSGYKRYISEPIRAIDETATNFVMGGLREGAGAVGSAADLVALPNTIKRSVQGRHKKSYEDTVKEYFDKGTTAVTGKSFAPTTPVGKALAAGAGFASVAKIAKKATQLYGPKIAKKFPELAKKATKVWNPQTKIGKAAMFVPKSFNPNQDKFIKSGVGTAAAHKAGEEFGFNPWVNAGLGVLGGIAGAKARIPTKEDPWFPNLKASMERGALAQPKIQAHVKSKLAEHHGIPTEGFDYKRQAGIDLHNALQNGGKSVGNNMDSINSALANKVVIDPTVYHPEAYVDVRDIVSPIFTNAKNARGPVDINNVTNSPLHKIAEELTSYVDKVTPHGHLPLERAPERLKEIWDAAEAAPKNSKLRADLKQLYREVQDRITSSMENFSPEAKALYQTRNKYFHNYSNDVDKIKADVSALARKESEAIKGVPEEFQHMATDVKQTGNPEGIMDYVVNPKENHLEAIHHHLHRHGLKKESEKLAKDTFYELGDKGSHFDSIEFFNKFTALSTTKQNQLLKNLTPEAAAQLEGIKKGVIGLANITGNAPGVGAAPFTKKMPKNMASKIFQNARVKFFSDFYKNPKATAKLIERMKADADYIKPSFFNETTRKGTRSSTALELGRRYAPQKSKEDSED